MSTVTSMSPSGGIDFTCQVCGKPTLCAPDPPARAVCPEHCEGHDYEYERDRRGWFCTYCDDEAPPNHWIYEI